MESRNSLLGRRIGIFGKGGSGKSTLAVLLSRAFWEKGYAICVLDADSTNIGLHQAFGLSASPAPLLDYFGGCVFAGGPVTCPVDDPTRLPGAELSVDKLPNEYVGNIDEGFQLLTAGKIAGQGAGAGCDGPVAKIARDIRVKSNGRDLVTLVDFKAGLEDSARGVLTSLDWALVVVEPNLAALQIAIDVKDTIEQIRGGALPATEHLQESHLIQSAIQIYQEALIQEVFVVLNKIHSSQEESYLEHELEVVGLSPIATIAEDQKIAETWLKGELLQGSALNVTRIVAALEEAEASRNLRGRKEMSRFLSAAQTPGT
jgi:CO dehydrogenase maturation factor